jgi:hypothetical protein
MARPTSVQAGAGRSLMLSWACMEIGQHTPAVTAFLWWPPFKFRSNGPGTYSVISIVPGGGRKYS